MKRSKMNMHSKKKNLKPSSMCHAKKICKIHMLNLI